MTPVDGNIWEMKKHVVPCDPVVAPYPKSGESSLADAKCSIWSLWLPCFNCFMPRLSMFFLYTENRVTLNTTPKFSILKPHAFLALPLCVYAIHTSYHWYSKQGHIDFRFSCTKRFSRTFLWPSCLFSTICPTFPPLPSLPFSLSLLTSKVTVPYIP